MQLMVESNCMPESPHWCVASAIWRISSELSGDLPLLTGANAAIWSTSRHRPDDGFHELVCGADRLLLAFWKKMDP